VISYNIGTKIPSHGMYACRVVGATANLLEDRFLQWDANGWSQDGIKFRGEVVGWVGPLQRNPSRRKGAW